ncbi:uncharacterized protein LOC143916436 [Arctopsyche grandis]|uniref:uncharacterized protein LOC143916436 n=1 Tax=Arctopsyche grandis TaxID=121162 RepID=UPI00406D6C12
MVGRPASVEFPQVWRRFERTLPDGTVKKFKIQDVTEDMYDDVMFFMEENFLKEEPFTLAAGIIENQKALEQMHNFWRNEVLPLRLSIVCFEDYDGFRTFMKPEIVAFNFLIHSVKGQKKDKKNAEPSEIGRILQEVDSRFNIYNLHQVKEYLTAAGLAVNKEYRGMNIGAEMLHARTPLCKAIGIRVTETIFSAVGSQVLASKAGFETLIEIKYDDLAEKLKLKFPDSAKTLKVMTKIID